jgi:hypothetical protein
MSTYLLNNVSMTVTLYSLKHARALLVAPENSCTTFWKASPVVTKDLISPVPFPAAVVRTVSVVENTLVATKNLALN